MKWNVLGITCKVSRSSGLSPGANNKRERIARHDIYTSGYYATTALPYIFTLSVNVLPPLILTLAPGVRDDVRITLYLWMKYGTIRFVQDTGRRANKGLHSAGAGELVGLRGRMMVLCELDSRIKFIES